MDTAIPVPKLPQPAQGVRVQPAPHGANKFPQDPIVVKTPEELLQKCCNKEFEKMRHNNLIQSSFDDIASNAPYLGASNGFVDSAVLAYSQHHHLIIRPEDVVSLSRSLDLAFPYCPLVHGISVILSLATR